MSMNAHAWVYQVRPIWFVRIDPGRPSEAKNCAPLLAAVIRPARKDSASFLVAKVRWWRVPATCHLTVGVVPRLPLYPWMAQTRTSQLASFPSVITASDQGRG